MLILTRRCGETIKINDDIDITILGVKANIVRLGIAAPKDVSVHREEIYEKIKNEKEHKNKELGETGNIKDLTVTHWKPTPNKKKKERDISDEA